MFLTIKVVAVACFLAITVNRISRVSAYPSSSSSQKRLIIYTPVKYKIVHHHKVERVPIVIKKHLHYHLNEREAKVKHYNHYHYTFEDYGHDDNHYSHQQQDDFDEHDFEQDDQHYFVDSQNHHSDEGHQGLHNVIDYKTQKPLKGFSGGMKSSGGSMRGHKYTLHDYDHGHNYEQNHGKFNHYYTWKGETTFDDNNYKVHDDYEDYVPNYEYINENENESDEYE